MGLLKFKQWIINDSHPMEMTPLPILGGKKKALAQARDCLGLPLGQGL